MSDFIRAADEFIFEYDGKSYKERHADIAAELDQKYEGSNYGIEDPFVVLNPFGLAPLAATVRFETEDDSQISITVEGKNGIDFSHTHEGFRKSHNLPILGLSANHENSVLIVAEDRAGNKKKNTVKIQTQKLPDSYPEVQVIKPYSGPLQDQLYFITLTVEKKESRGGMTSGFDAKGNVRLVLKGVSDALMPLKNGHYLVILPRLFLEVGDHNNTFYEIDLTGRVHNELVVEKQHHDIHEMENGNFLVLAQDDDSLMDVVVEVERETGAIVGSWDFKEILDPNRVGTIDKVAFEKNDWLHLNTVYYEPEDNTIVVSSRNQSAIIKIDKDTKALKWILGPPGGWAEEFLPYILKPTGDDFSWSWAQHQPVTLPNSDIALFDNGNFRSLDIENAVFAHENASRAVRYRIDDQAMTVRQIWQYGGEREEKLFAPYRGGVSYVAQDNSLLVCFCGLYKDRYGTPLDDVYLERGRNEIRVVEVDFDQPANVLFEIELSNEDYRTELSYRGYRALKAALY